MRLLFACIVLGAAGYLGWELSRESRPIGPPALAGVPGPPAPVATSGDPHSTPAPPGGLPQTTRPGIYYATERVAVQTATGVKALHPGEEVRLMYRSKSGSMLVTNGRDEFVVKSSSLSKERPPIRSATTRQP